MRIFFWWIIFSPFRSRIILRAAGLVATKYRYDTLARVMIGQGKTSIQADIDSVAELVDFLKFNVQYGKVWLLFTYIRDT